MSRWGTIERDSKEFNKAIEALKSDIFNKASKIYLTRIVFICDSQTKKLTPVDTGHLRSSWNIGQLKIAGSKASIDYFNNAEYAMYVEYGHRTNNGKKWVEGQFMLTKAVKVVDSKSGVIATEAIREAMK